MEKEEEEEEEARKFCPNTWLSRSPISTCLLVCGQRGFRVQWSKGGVLVSE